MGTLTFTQGNPVYQQSAKKMDASKYDGQTNDIHMINNQDFKADVSLGVGGRDFMGGKTPLSLISAQFRPLFDNDHRAKQSVQNKNKIIGETDEGEVIPKQNQNGFKSSNVKKVHGGMIPDYFPMLKGNLVIPSQAGKVNLHSATISAAPRFGYKVLKVPQKQFVHVLQSLVKKSKKMMNPFFFPDKDVLKQNIPSDFLGQKESSDILPGKDALNERTPSDFLSDEDILNQKKDIRNQNGVFLDAGNPLDGNYLSQKSVWNTKTNGDDQMLDELAEITQQGVTQQDDQFNMINQKDAMAEGNILAGDEQLNEPHLDMIKRKDSRNAADEKDLSQEISDITQDDQLNEFTIQSGRPEENPLAKIIRPEEIPLAKIIRQEGIPSDISNRIDPIEEDRFSTREADIPQEMLYGVTSGRDKRTGWKKNCVPDPKGCLFLKTKMKTFKLCNKDKLVCSSVDKRDPERTES